MSGYTKFQASIYLRTRLLRRVWFRACKSLIISKAKNLISNVKYESQSILSSSVPSIILSSFGQLSDFLILTYLFKDQDLTFLATRAIPQSKISRWLRSFNHVLYIEDYKMGYPLFREILGILRDFNRSIVISPAAAQQYMSHISVNPVTIIKIAMIANSPIVPVRFGNCQKKISANGKPEKRDIWIGKPLYISPRTEEFKDVFFKRRGVRKYDDLSEEELQEIGRRIFLKLEPVEA